MVTPNALANQGRAGSSFSVSIFARGRNGCRNLCPAFAQANRVDLGAIVVTWLRKCHALSSRMSIPFFWHRHERILLDPLVEESHIELRESPDFHERNSPLTDHRVQGMRGEACVSGYFLNGPKALIHLFFSVDGPDTSRGMVG